MYSIDYRHVSETQFYVTISTEYKHEKQKLQTECLRKLTLLAIGQAENNVFGEESTYLKNVRLRIANMYRLNIIYKSSAFQYHM